MTWQDEWWKDNEGSLSTHDIGGFQKMSRMTISPTKNTGDSLTADHQPKPGVDRIRRDMAADRACRQTAADDPDNASRAAGRRDQHTPPH